MELKRLSHLVALADEGNFGKAAERVHLSQPAFSRSIQAAEEEWGLALFERGGTQVRPTPAGAFVIDRVRNVLRDSRGLERDVQLYRDRHIGELAFGMGPFPAPALLPLLLLDLRKQFPAVHVRVQVNNTSNLISHIRHEEHDFFVGDVRYVQGDDTFDVRRIGTIPGALYVRASHPLLAQPTVTMAMVAACGLASGRLPHEVEVFLARLMGRTPSQGVPIALECDDFSVLKGVVMASDLVLIGTPSMFQFDSGPDRLVPVSPVDLPPSHSEVGVVSLRGRTFSPVAAYAVKFLEESMAGRPAGAQAQPVVAAIRARTGKASRR